MQTMQQSTDTDTPDLNAWDNEIARAYLYGDLVHSDDSADLLDALGEDRVLFAAGAVAADGFMLMNNTYEALRCLRPDIAPDHGYFSKRHHEFAARSPQTSGRVGPPDEEPSAGC